MRFASALAAALVMTACVASDAPDGKDDLGLGGGKADGDELSDCQKAAIVTYLNDGITADALEAAGLHARAAKNLAAHRDGADGRFGTDDDDLFDSIDEVDDVDYTGPTAFTQLAAATLDRCTMPSDIYAEARDVTKALITFPPGTVAPTSYDYPSAASFNLSGTEFWQKWSGGKNPTYSFGEGTDAGRLCLQASAIRFETIMKDPPAELVKLDADTNWSGSFYNWNDDYSQSDYGDGSAPRLWAWRTSLVKWISQTKKDGSCLLPTRDLVIKAATACLSYGPEIQGCSATL
jgi:hypothetical protein